MELLLWATHGVLSGFNAFQTIFPLAQLKLAPWRYYSKYFHCCKALKYTVFAAKPLIFLRFTLTAAIFSWGHPASCKPIYCFQNNLSAGNRCWLPLRPTGVPSGLLPDCAVLFPMREAAALKFQLLLQAVPTSSLFRGGFHGFCCRLALCHNSYSVVLSAATQRFGRRNWVLFAILPAIKMLSPFPHTRIMHADSNSTLFHKSEFAHKLPQSIFSVKSFFPSYRNDFQATNSQEGIISPTSCIFTHKFIWKKSICLTLWHKHIRFSTFFTDSIFLRFIATN